MKPAPPALQTPDISFSLYGGEHTIDFFEKYVKNGHAYKHVYIHRTTQEWPISVTGATGMVDKSIPLGIWQEKLSRTYLLDLIKGKRKPIPLTEEIIMTATALYRTKRDEGSAAGTEVHDWIENFLSKRNPLMPTDEKALNGVNAFLEWYAENDVEVETTEQIVYSPIHEYVGKLDVIIKAKVPGRGNKKFRILFDYKTNNWSVNKKTGITESRVYDEQRYQLAGYRGAWEEEKGEGDIAGRYLLSLDKDTGRFKAHFLDEDPTAFKKDFNCFLAALTLKKRNKELTRGW